MQEINKKSRTNYKTAEVRTFSGRKTQSFNFSKKQPQIEKCAKELLEKNSMHFYTFLYYQLDKIDSDNCCSRNDLRNMFQFLSLLKYLKMRQFLT